ncbi:MAG: IS66 family transposase [Gammaproteobacteria bacterium]
MEVRLDCLPNDIAELKQVIASQQAIIEDKEQTITRNQAVITCLEEKLRLLQQQRFGRRSEKYPGQQELQLFNEAELLQAQPEPEAESADTITVPAHTRKRKKPRVLAPDLPRCEVIYDLPEADKQCTRCGKTLSHIDNEELEQLAVIPQQYYVIVHVKKKYACSCKGCIRTAGMPAQPLPASQASPQLLAHIMVSKYHDGLPLPRQEKMALREGLELSRAKLARWLISVAALFQPIWNLLQDTLFSYDIAQSDETGIQVLKEHGRRPENKSYLWIRRGGPPDRPVVLVDYSPSRSGETAHGLLEEFRGYLVCDAYEGYSPTIRTNGLLPVFCNDHARRKFVDVMKSLTKDSRHPERAKDWIANQAIERYKPLYRIEREIKELSVQAKYEARQARAVPLWDAFIEWAEKMQAEGVAHQGTREALNYLITHAEGLRRYCDDGRLPISNILAEHTAKTIAVARTNFLFADTPAGAESSARIYSLLETAKANGHHTQRYLSVLLTELPNAACVEDIESLLPWNITPEEISRRYATYPAP